MCRLISQFSSVGRTKRKRSRKGQNSRNLASEDVVISLCRWMKFSGWKNTSMLSLRDFEHTGRGIFSKKTLNKHEILIQIPYNLMITYSTIYNSEILKIISRNKNQALLLHDLLALFLAFERHKDSKSEWKFYLDSLPQQPPPLLFTSDFNEIESLPEAVKDLALPSRWKFEESWKRVLESIAPRWKCVCCRKERDRVFTFDSYRWAYAMVNTRAVYVDPQTVKDLSKLSEASFNSLISDEPCMALCPYLDMFNHSCDAKTEAALKKTTSGWVYELKTLTSYKKNQQIFISYGAHDNLKLLCEYGFFLPGNKIDRVNFAFKRVLDILQIKLNTKQYKFIMERNFNSDLHVSCLGLSFNLKAMLFVASASDMRIWNSCIFSENYSKEVFEQMVKRGRCLLEFRVNENLNWLRRFETDELSEWFSIIVKYVNHENVFIDNLCKLLEM